MSKEQGIICEVCGEEIAPPEYRRVLNAQGLRELQERHMRDYCPPAIPAKQSEAKSNICTVCGGIIRIAYTIAFEQGRPHDISVSEVPPGYVRLCPGHFPEQDKQHDGKLGVFDPLNQCNPTVSLHDGMHVKIDDDHDYDLGPFVLTASQALSLLTWLLQERRQLEEIAAETEAAKERRE